MKPQPGTNVIKQESRKRSGVLKHRTLASEQEAKRIVAQADAYAKQTAEDAETGAEKAYREAKERGRLEAIAEFHSLVLKASELRDDALEKAEHDLLLLAVKLAEKIVGRELLSEPDTIVDIVNAALQHARQRESLMIRVNPSDLPRVQKEIEKFKASAQSKFIDISADPHVDSGGCLIESEVGTVDARLETQFRVLRKALLNRAKGEPQNSIDD